MGIKNIVYLSDWAEVNPENDNIDVLVALEDGRQYTFVVATPNNVFRCMENEGTDYFFGEPMLFVKNLTVENIERAERRSSMRRRVGGVGYVNELEFTLRA